MKVSLGGVEKTKIRRLAKGKGLEVHKKTTQSVDSKIHTINKDHQLNLVTIRVEVHKYLGMQLSLTTIKSVSFV